MDHTLSGKVIEIQRMSTEDGPGLRTTVFLKGCPLHCTWCHNPESIDPKPELSWSANACIGCRTCIESCDASALCLAEATGMAINKDKCTRCGACTNACPAMALTMTGTSWTPENLVAELIKDKTFFEVSENGGITLSGGELTLQADFCETVLEVLGDHGIHRAIDTCGQCATSSLTKLLPHTDLVLFDLKEMDPARHKAFTGRSNRAILENAKQVAHWIATHDRPRSMWIRTPVIPGATQDDDNISAMGQFIAEHLQSAVSRWELCTFNNLCKDKYEARGVAWRHKDSELVTKEEISRLAELAGKSGINPAIVHWSGATRT